MRSRTALLAALLLVALCTPFAPAAHAAPAPITVALDLDLQDDGTLAVSTTTTVPEGSPAIGVIPLAVPVEGNRTQHFAISDIETEGGAQADIDGDQLRIVAPAGTTTVRYRVRGTVADSPGLQQFTWILTAGWSAPVAALTGTFSSPTPRPDSPICAYGQIGVRRLCTMTQTQGGGAVSFEHRHLEAGMVAVFSVLLPAGTVTATAQFTDTVTTAGGGPAADRAASWAVLAATLLGLGLTAAAALRRRTDRAAVTGAVAPAELLAAHDGVVDFVSPDGVLPGQVGALLAGHARPADFGATVFDLAVRNYLWITEAPDRSGAVDFHIARRAPLDGAITDHERAVVEAILPNDRKSVSVAELARGGAGAVGTAAAVDEWRCERRIMLRRIGFGLLAIGALAAVGTALAGGPVLWATAVLILGAGVAVAATLLPARNRSGTRVAAALTAMRIQLATLDPDGIEPSSRPVLFQRGLPYAHALGDLRIWLRRWGGGPKATDWYRPAGDRPLAAGLPVLAALLDGIAAGPESTPAPTAAPKPGRRAH